MRRPGVHIELSKVTIPLLVSHAASRRSKWRMTFPGTGKDHGVGVHMFGLIRRVLTRMPFRSFLSVWPALIYPPSAKSSKEAD